MSDWAKTLQAKSDQINNVDLAGEPITIKITDVKTDNSADQKASISFEGSTKVFRPCLGMRRLMSLVWKTTEPRDFIGRSMTLYREEDVRYGKDVTGGTRISHMSHITEPQTHAVPVRRGQVKAYTVQPLRLPDAKPMPTAPDAQAAARDAARQGKASFAAWWKANPDARDLVKPIMAELQELTAGVRNDDPPI